MNFNKNYLLFKFCFLTIFTIAFISCTDDDTEDSCNETTWYQDNDSDGLGNPNVFLDACDQPEGYVADNTDVDDTVAFCEVFKWYKDADGDGLGNADVTTEACDQPEGYVADNTDLDDEPYGYYVGIEFGSDGADFLSTASSLSEGIVSPVNNGFEQLDWANYIQGVDQIFSVVGSTLTSYEKDENGDLKEGLSVTTGLGLFAWDVVDESTLIGVGSPWYAAGTKEIYLIDTDAMSITTTIQTSLGDFTNSAEDYGISLPTSAKVVGNNLFISYLLFDAEGNNVNVDLANVAVYSYPGLEFKEIISDDRASTVGRYFSQFGLAVDENSNIYTISPSSLANGYFPIPTNKSSILKINSGETDFDDDYYLDFETLSGGYKLNDIYYVANGKAVVRFSIDDSVAWSTYSPYSETPILGYGILDLETSSFIDLSSDMELGGGGWNGTSLIEGTSVYVGVSNRTYSGIYVIDVENGSVAEGVDVDGNYAKGILSLK